MNQNKKNKQKDPIKGKRSKNTSRSLTHECVG